MAHHEMTGRNHTERRSHRLLTRDEMDILVDKTCAYFRVDEEALRNNFKGNVTHDLSYRARQVVMYLAWVCYDTSVVEIAAYIGTDKTAARRAQDQVEDWRGAQLHLDSWLTRVEQDIIQRRITRARHS